jgi:hypothetical protein
MKKLTFLAALAVSPLLFVARPAEAGIEACGNIHEQSRVETGQCIIHVKGSVTYATAISR